MASTSHVIWEGSVEEGKGHIGTGSGTVDADYTAAGRFADGGGTNPEELIAAAHAACFSMALSLVLGNAGIVPDSIDTNAKAYIRKQGDGFEIHKIELATVGTVPGIDEAEFVKQAETAKAVCPVSKALAGVGEVTLEAKLAS